MELETTDELRKKNINALPTANIVLEIAMEVKCFPSGSSFPAVTILRCLHSARVGFGEWFEDTNT